MLADGLFVHTAKVDVPFETDVTLPNISCKRCTLQVIQFMEQHGVNNPGMFTYRHCAVLQITPDPKLPIGGQGNAKSGGRARPETAIADA